MVELLIGKRVSLKASDNSGCTALHYAALHRHMEVVRLLIVEGANIEARDANGATVLKMEAGLYATSPQ